MKLTDQEQSRIFNELSIDNAKRIVTLNNYGVDGLSNNEYVNNVYCIDSDNNIIWRIKTPENIGDNDAFNAFINDNGELMVSRSSGEQFALNSETGHLTYVKYQR